MNKDKNEPAFYNYVAEELMKTLNDTCKKVHNNYAVPCLSLLDTTTTKPAEGHVNLSKRSLFLVLSFMIL